MVGEDRLCDRSRSGGRCRTPIITLGLAAGLALVGCGNAVETLPYSGLAITQAFEVIGDDTLTPAAVNTTEEPLSFTAMPALCCNSLSIQFSIIPEDTWFPSGTSIEWDFGDGRLGSGFTENHTYSRSGEYVVTLNVNRPYGVTATVQQTLFLSFDTATGIEISIFAPIEPADVDSEMDTVIVAVTEAPTPGDEDDGPGHPVANAGPDKTVAPGELVQLDGTGSTAGALEPASYSWSQMFGPAVILSDAESAAATFVAPQAGDEPVTLGFELRVSVAGVTDSDTVTVSVVQQPDEPVGQSPPGMTVVFLSGPDGVAEPGPADVSWTFVNDVGESDVFLRQDCCGCRDIDSAVLTADPNGVYRGTIDIPPDGTIWYSVLYTSQGVPYRSQSVYVNTARRPAPEDSPPVIWSHNRQHDPAILREVIRSGIATHVLIRGGDRVVQAFDDPGVMEAIAICRSAGLEVIWSRHLWNNFREFQTLEDVFDPAFYASAIAQVQAEGAALGADFTAMDCEAYRNAPLDDFLANILTPDDFEAMGAATTQAAGGGQVDFVMPSGFHGRPMHANNLYQPLGRNRIAQSTYWDMPHKNCRISYPYDVFGAFIRPRTERPEMGLVPYFLPYDIVQRRYLWSQEDGAPGMVNGLLFYTDGEANAWETAAMLAAFFDTP